MIAETWPDHGAMRWRACIATKLAVTSAPCQHGYTWQCPRAADVVALLIGARDQAMGRGGVNIEWFVEQVDRALPWLKERRRGPDRRRTA